MRRHIIALASIALLAGAAGAWASEFAEGFEPYPVGVNVHGQGGWKGWDNVPAAGAPVSNLVAQAGRNSIEITAVSDLVHEFDLSGGKWVLTAWQYIPAQSRGTTYFILLNTYQDGGPYDWSVQTEFNLSTGAITPVQGAAGEEARIIYNEWVEIRIVIDLGANTVEEYYDGVMFAAHEWDDDEHGTLAAIDLYGNGASSVYYDEIAIDSATPPTSASCFPRPAYDSGWVTTPFGSPSDFYTTTLTHGLGGNAEDYFVDLQMTVGGIAGPNLTNQGLGTVFSYSFLNARSVNVTAPYSAVDLVTSVRLRIWVYCDAETNPGEPRPQ